MGDINNELIGGNFKLSALSKRRGEVYLLKTEHTSMFIYLKY
jgi:hypothetical protein